MTLTEATNHFIALSRELESELIKAYNIKEKRHPLGSEHENVMQWAGASDCLDLSEWNLMSDGDKKLNENILLSQIQGRVKSYFEEATTKWPDMKFFRLSVNWLNMFDAEANPSGTIGRFMVFLQGVNNKS